MNAKQIIGLGSSLVLLTSSLVACSSSSEATKGDEKPAATEGEAKCGEKKCGEGKCGEKAPESAPAPQN